MKEIVEKEMQLNAYILIINFYFELTSSFYRMYFIVKIEYILIT